MNIKKVAWIIFAMSCIMTGLYPIIYFTIDRKFGLLSSKSPELLSSLPWNIAFYGHIVLGGLALLVGWIQFSNKLRQKNISKHRTIGKVYIYTALVSGLCGLIIAQSATGGWNCRIGFTLSALVWLSTTIIALMAVKNGNINKHQRFMLYSYAVCFSAVTLRIWLPLLTMSLGGFIEAYRIVAWLSWVPNLIVAHIIANKIISKV